ncbi:MAG: sulfur reduction protein DsrE [Chloroflexi bacterium]|nr:sulfur reduction protein DsrE [Chloroflexota bacterium]
MATKLVIMVTHGPGDPEMATIPFVMGVAALASEMEVVMGFQSNGVYLIKKGIAETVHANGFDSLKDLMDTFVEEGGKLYVCGPCIQSRNINPETDFVEGAKVVSAATFAGELAEAQNALTY